MPLLEKLANKYFMLILTLISAFYLRMVDMAYGIDHVCLTPQAELWLQEPATLTSLYALYPQMPIGLSQTVASGINLKSTDWFILRYVGALSGILSITFSLAIWRTLNKTLSWLFAILMAVMWLFVLPDRLLVRFDPALLCVVISTWAIMLQRRGDQRSVIQWLGVLSSLALLVVAPPLWWLAIVFLVMTPRRNNRQWIAVFLTYLILFPGLASPVEWFSAAAQWDTGTTAALAWCVLTFILSRNLPRFYWDQWLYGGIIAVCGLYSLWCVISIPHPSESDWTVIRLLQGAIPNGATVEMALPLSPYVDVIRCPAQVNIQAVFTPYVPSDRPLEAVLTVVETVPVTMFYTQRLDERYTLIRNFAAENPMVASVGDQLVILNASLLTPIMTVNNLLDVRLDFQLTNQLNENLSVVGIFVHVTQVGQPGDKVLEFGYPFGLELGSISPRELLLNYHIRTRVRDITPGTYDVIVGFVNNVNGEELTRLTVGQVTISAE